MITPIYYLYFVSYTYFHIEPKYPLFLLTAFLQKDFIVIENCTLRKA